MTFQKLSLTLLLCAALGAPLHADAQEPPTQPGMANQSGTKDLTPDGEPEEMGEDGYIEVVVDEEGKLYQKRHYGGIIPDVHDRFVAGVKSGKPGGGHPAITWVGFQQRSLFSRVFIQTDRITAYTIYKPDPLHIYVDFPGASIPLRNDRRTLDTSRFETPVRTVDARILRGKDYRGARVIITLDSPTGYLYKQEGNYVFIDIER